MSEVEDWQKSINNPLERSHIEMTIKLKEGLVSSLVNIEKAKKKKTDIKVQSRSSNIENMINLRIWFDKKQPNNFKEKKLK